MDRTKLQSANIHWEPEDISLTQRDLNSLSEEEKLKLITLLDRRLFQLWNKVSFERENNLVDYSSIRDKLGITK